MSASPSDNTQAASERAVTSEKETDDPRRMLTTDEAAKPPSGEQPSRIIGEYEVLGPLGSGGMGEVYKARHRRLNKLVALKLLPANSRDPREAAARFQREMKAIGDLDHPNVVEAHDAGEQSGVIYLAMKLIDGVDLERLVKQRGPLPIREACDLVRQAALGLHYLHQRSLVHRDIKPSNLMRTPDGTVKVLDLGLARWCLEAEKGDGLTGMWQAMGTPDFLAPEQIENAADVDARADLYGLGGTLFYLLTGHAPFADRKSQFSKLEAHRSEPPPDVRTLRPDVPAELSALLHRLLAKKPEQRYPNAAEAAAALAPFAGGACLEQVPTVDRESRPPQAPVDGETNQRPALKLAIGLASGKRSCLLTLTFGFAVAVLIGLPAWLWFTQSVTERQLTTQQQEVAVAPSPPPQAQPPLPPMPLESVRGEGQKPEVMRLDVRLTRNVNGGGQPAGLLGEKVFDSHRGDTVMVQAQLTRRAYALLIAFRPDGKTELCFPEKEDEPPPLTENPRYPSTPESAGREYALSDGEGLQAFALVVSSQPLPAYKDWWPQRKGCPWKKEDAPPGLVYRANGEGRVETLGGAASRGMGAPVKGKTPVAELAAWLRKAPGIETVQVLGFTVGPKANR